MIVCNDSRVSEFCKNQIGYSAITDVANIGWERDGKIVSGVVYTDFNGRNITAGIATIQPFARRFLWAIFDYPFNQLQVTRITATVETDNFASHRILRRMGFEYEASLKDAGRHGDLHIYRMFKQNCPILEKLRC